MDVASGSRRRSLARIYQRALALGLAGLVHVFLLWIALTTAAGAEFMGGAVGQFGKENAVFVSLAGIPGVRNPTALKHEQEQNADLMRLLQEVIRAQPVLASDPNLSVQSNPDRLKELLDALQETSAEQDGSFGTSEMPQGGKASNGHDSDLEDERNSGEKSNYVGEIIGDGGSGDGLLGAIQPCWERTPGVSRVPVTLEILLNSAGRLATPPRIIRPRGAAIDQERLVSEARAISAVAACMPYEARSFADAQHRLEFGPSR